MVNAEDVGYGLKIGALDPIGIGDALAALAIDRARRPLDLTQDWLDFGLAQTRAGLHFLSRCLGDKPEPDSAPNGDRRFADRAWRDNPFLATMLESYLVWQDQVRGLVDRSGLEDETRQKAAFGIRAITDALAPSNLPWLNPAVLKEAIDTGGLSLARGMANFVDDAIHNRGYPRQVDRTPFELGKNLAATPGRVVFRNDLIELIAYEPRTPTVYAEPILCSPPWINKYYVMDLAPNRSFIQHAVDNGFRVFAVSYRNPDATMATFTMDTYLEKGLLKAIELAGRISGSPRVNLVGLCLGGTLTVVALAYLASNGFGDRIGWAAVTNTLVDFGQPGDLGVFTDEQTVVRLEEQMKARGFLEASDMAGTFDWLRANDLIWNYVVSNWYMGKQPSAFDILAWNADSTNMPAAMHSQYLRTCYLQNALVKPGEFIISGTPIDLRAIETPIYVLAAENDHIAPWRSAYRTTQLTGGETRFTLTSAGHIAGIVNPIDSPKSQYWTREGCPPSAEEWRSGAAQHQGSWWADWLAWAAQRSGEQIPAPALPPGDPAPGLYVRNETGPAFDLKAAPAPRPRRPRRTAPSA